MVTIENSNAHRPFTIAVHGSNDFFRHFGFNQTPAELIFVFHNVDLKRYVYHCFIILNDNVEVGILQVVNRWNRYEVGYYIIPEHRGHGYTIPAMNQLLTMMKNEGIDKIVAETVKQSNEASKHILHELGFQIVKERKKTCDFVLSNTLE